MPSDDKSFDEIRSFIQGLIARAQSGDETALPGLRRTLANLPVLVKDLGGDLAEQAEDRIVRRLAGNDLPRREAIFQKLRDLRAELGGVVPSPSERLLIDRVALSWLRLHETELQQATTMSNDVKEVRYRESRIEMLNRQYLEAIKTLAKVRRLSAPLIVGQLNIASKQVNVAGLNALPAGG